MAVDILVAEALEAAEVGIVGEDIIHGPSVNAPTAAVFVIALGGRPPICLLGGKTLLRHNIQVIVRWRPYDYSGGLAFARQVHTALYEMELGSPTVFRSVVRESEPVYIRKDAEDRPGWSINVHVWEAIE